MLARVVLATRCVELQGTPVCEAQLEVAVLANSLQYMCGDLRELDHTLLRLGKRACRPAHACAGRCARSRRGHALEVVVLSSWAAAVPVARTAAGEHVLDGIGHAGGLVVNLRAQVAPVTAPAHA